MKAWAILLVVCAHCAGVTAQSEALCKTASRLLNSVGSLGVPVFLFLAGYVFQYKKLCPWLKGKLTSFLIPWLFTGTLTYLYVYLRKGGISIFTFATWLVGAGSYLWYLSVQSMLWIGAWILFWGKEKWGWPVRSVAIVAMLISLVALHLNALGVMRLHVYLHPLRWLWLFALGVLAREISAFDRLRRRVSLSVMWLVLLVVATVMGWQCFYGAWYFPICALAAVASVMNMRIYNGKLASYLEILGRDSFTVYLLHMPVAGVVSNLCNRVPDPTGLVTLSRPFVVLLITHGSVLLLRWAARFIRKEKIIGIAFGFR